MNSDYIWEHIFNTLNIDVNQNIVYITSTQIKDCKTSWTGNKNQFEPRLLCKMDTYNSRPNIFKKNNIFILSVKNGLYALIKNNIYIPLKKYYGPANIIPQKTNSLILDIGNSEMSMLDNLLYNGVLSDIIGEKIEYGPFRW